MTDTFDPATWTVPQYHARPFARDPERWEEERAHQVGVAGLDRAR
jgi:hypothetical protein